MKKIGFTIMILNSCFKLNAQQWLGSSTSSNNIYRKGDITAIDGNMSRVTLGAAWGGAPIWGGGYLGINLRRESSGLWSYLSNGSNNQGIAIYETGGSLMFSFKPSTGGSTGTITDANVHNNTSVRMHSNGTVNLYKGDLKVRPDQVFGVSLGAAWGGSGMHGTGYIGFNLSRENVLAGNWPYFTNGAQNGGSVIYGTLDGDLIFSLKPNTGSGTGAISDADVMQNGKMRLTSSGKLVLGEHTIGGWGGIGSVDYNSNNYLLFVEKGILTEKVRVAIKGTPEWSDFVFADDYQLMPLKKLEQFIEAENHLPEIPSAEEVVKEGIDVAQMQAKLLQKIEELTLYVIRQQKEIDGLQEQIRRFKK